MHQMTDTERAERVAVKTLHENCRRELERTRQKSGQDHRYAILAWGFVRGFNYRRLERRRHFQTNGGRLADVFSAPVAGRPGVAPFEHNVPCLSRLHAVLSDLFVGALPALGRFRVNAPLSRETVRAWLAEPSPDLACVLAADAARGTLEPPAAAE